MKTKSFVKINYLLTFLFALASPFLPNPALASTITCGFPGSCSVNVNSEAKDVMSEIENRYGFDQDVWLKAKRKADAPRVEIFFDNTNPRPGEKVTASALPEFFKNDPQNLYYTWYLIHTENGTPQTATNSITNGKKEAQGIMARGDYDPELDGQTYPDKDADPDRDGWPAIDKNSFEEDTTAAPMGGADGVGGLPEETVEEFSSATEWCDSLGDHSWDDCSLNDEVNFRPLETYYLPESDQTNHYCKLCENYFSGDGLAAYNSTKSARNNCCYANMTNLDCVDGDGNLIKCPYDGNIDYCGLTNNNLFDSCYDNFRESNKSTLSSCLNTEYQACRTDWATVHQDADGDGLSDLNEEDTTQVSRCYKHNFGTNSGANIFRENELSSNSTSDESGLDYSVSCKHKWLNASGYKSGSGKFPTGEEEYWKTDPTDPDTNGDGFSDEASIIGLGQQNFSWTYQAGDRVGVVVEGTSMIPTDEKNAYYKIMWGYPDVCDATKKDLLDGDGCDDSDDFGFGFLATKAPSEEGSGEELKLSLSFTPDNPIADPSSENNENIADDGTIQDADAITITSSLDNTDFNPQNLYYTWQISKSTDLSGENWKEVKDLEDNFSLASPTAGLGLSNLTFSPKKSVLTEDSSEIIYFKITLTASTASGVKTNRGRSSVVIPVNKNGIKIGLFKVEVVDGKASLGEEVCTEGLYKIMCPAVQYQMLGAKVTSAKYDLGNSDFSWSLDGVSYDVPAEQEKHFTGLDNRTKILPITKNEQEFQEISVTATPKDQLAPVTGGRTITVVHPAAFIKSDDSTVSWPFVQTVPDESKKNAFLDIESKDTFQVLTNEKALFGLDFVPSYLLAKDDLNLKIDWLVNGKSVLYDNPYDDNPDLDIITLSDNQQQLIFPTSEIENQYYILGANVTKYWSDEEMNILGAVWNITPQTLYGETSATFSTIAEKPGAPDEPWGAQANPTQILAAIGTHLPHYLMYNLRLALTIFVMFFVSSGFYALSQKFRFYEKK